MSDKDRAVTLGEWANMAISKHTRKIFKYEAGVLEDKDPEDLHQMRVGMRRLRSAIASFAVALDLPKTVNEKNIAKIGRSLGTLRDLDVLLAALKDNY
ncbi:MAG: CHAD domain-containing protein [Pleurocapsa sp. MO_192.B19]|nr:CHAD domain-containing protein [Pleurocapsa sp. MO_192.B19]